MNPLLASPFAGIFLAPVLALATAVSGGAGTPAVSAAPDAAASSSQACVSLSRNLMFGSRDSSTDGQVSALQAFLIQDGDMHAGATGYFGMITQRAVQRFQSSQGIFTTGYVGALTRAAVSRASCGGNPPPAATFYIRSISPDITTVGSSVTIYGGGFTQDNTINFGIGSIDHVASYDGTTLTFTVPSSLTPACYYSEPQCLIASQETTPGTYAVSVTNGSGTSNSVSITINDGQQQASNVRIFSITPSSGPTGTTVSIVGSGFAASNTIRFGSGAIADVPVSSSVAIACTNNPSCHGGINQTLQFTVPTSLGAYCPAGVACPMYAMLVTAGTYNVSVSNSSGTSDPVAFTVTGGPSISPVGNGPTITGIDAPASLSVGSTGTWTVHASAIRGSTASLQYSVDWGDEAALGNGIMSPQPSSTQSSAAFTHSYSRPGTYTAVFSVSDTSGNVATANSTVTVMPLY